MSVLHEARVICTLAWPSCIANMTFLSSMAVMAFVGQYGTDALAGAGLGFISRAAAP
jgi:Na+-driven multidrug efflux pump